MESTITNEEETMLYLETNVYEEAMKRIEMIYDNFDDVIVYMSGGKDSTVLFHMTLDVAKKRGRLPLKIFWLDQEAEWQATVDYMDKLCRRPDVEPYWFQVPFAFPNNLSTKREVLMCWDPSCPNKWVHPKSDIAYTEIPDCVTEKEKAKLDNRDVAFYILMDALPRMAKTGKKVAQLSGMRINESPKRRQAIAMSAAVLNGETWGTKEVNGVQQFWPIYDFTNDDIWIAIAKNHWEYNPIYDMQYQYGCTKNRMRVSALIHETAWWSIQMLHEFEPETYNRLVARCPGTSTFEHGFSEDSVMPSGLPFAFKDWKEYRDYLLEKLVDPKYHEMYRKRWKDQEGDDWYTLHVREIVLNDSCGTLNQNHKLTLSYSKKIEKLKERDRIAIQQYFGGKVDD